MSIFDAVIHSDVDGVVCGGVPVTHGMAVREYIAASGLDEADALRGLWQCHAVGAVRVELTCFAPVVPLEKEWTDSVFDYSPELSDLAGYEREWDAFPEYNDYMRPDSPVHQTKTYQAEIYRDMLENEISELNSGASVLDAGGGVGRMVPHLARTGARIAITDISRRALMAAWRTLVECDARRYDLACRHAAHLSCFEDNTFDLVLALELLCYLDDPAAAMAELARVCRPGGVVAISVENKPGAALGSGMSLDQLELLAKSDVLHEPGLSFTRYFTRGDVVAMVESAGLVVRRVEGCHFLADGPFRALAAETALADPRRRALCHAAECLCRESDLLSNLPRAWFVLARKRP